MSTAGTPNICGYKQDCLKCKKVQDLDLRPDLCISIRCKEYDPCPICKQNRTLHETTVGRKLCKVCIEKDPASKAAALEAKKAALSSGNPPPPPGMPVRKIGMSLPGTPPSGMEPQETEYYNERWKNFAGYYRNPAAYFTCHTLILEEINLNYLNSQQIEFRGQLSSELKSARSNALHNLKTLMDSLPEKEAEDVADDEKALSMIYESYSRQVKRRLTGVSRVFTTEALALDPALDFPTNPRALLERAGFTLINMDALIARITIDKKIHESMTPEDFLKALGFRIEEEYAQPFDAAMIETPEVSDAEAEAGLGDDDEEQDVEP